MSESKTEQKEVVVFQFPRGSFQKDANNVTLFDIEKEFSIRGFSFFSCEVGGARVYKRGKESAKLIRKKVNYPCID